MHSSGVLQILGISVCTLIFSLIRDVIVVDGGAAVQQVPLDGRCSRPDICADPNAVCVSGFCVCDNRFAAQNATCGTYAGDTAQEREACARKSFLRYLIN